MVVVAFVFISLVACVGCDQYANATARLPFRILNYLGDVWFYFFCSIPWYILCNDLRYALKVYLMTMMMMTTLTTTTISCLLSFVRSLFPFLCLTQLRITKFARSLLSTKSLDRHTHSHTVRSFSRRLFTCEFISRWNVFWVIRVYWSPVALCVVVVVVYWIFSFVIFSSCCVYALAIFSFSHARDTNSNKNCSYLKYLFLSMFTIVRMWL